MRNLLSLMGAAPGPAACRPCSGALDVWGRALACACAQAVRDGVRACEAVALCAGGPSADGRLARCRGLTPGARGP